MPKRPPSRNNSRVTAVIPARWGSQRLPGKVLEPIDGRPMVEHVHARVSRAARIGRVIVATDDQRVADAVDAFGGEAWLTSGEHQSGTARVAEVARQLEADIVINVQADEPLVDPMLLDRMVDEMEGDLTAELVSAATTWPEQLDYEDRHQVKVAVDGRGYALYFSRSPIGHGAADGAPAAMLHVGVYAFRRRALALMAASSPSALERAEGLEQLRALHLGLPIKLVTVSSHAGGVDTPADLERVRTELSELREQDSGNHTHG